MKLVYDKPETKGVENAIKRAKQMTEFRWTPVRSLPALLAYYDMEGIRHYCGWQIPPYSPQKGLVYSSVSETQKYIGFNVSFEAFVTALANPESVLYKQNLYGHGRQNANTWYGVVCSCFASYVFALNERCICREWPNQPNVRCLGQPVLNDLKLLDIVLNVKKHVAVITGIGRDENGNVQRIEVSESIIPAAASTWFTPEEFAGFWYARDFLIYRKDDTEGIPYEASQFVRIEADSERGIEADPELPAYGINPDILPNQGNGTNYKEDQEIILNLLNDNWDGAFISNEAGEEAYFDAVDDRVIVPADSRFHLPGFYTAYAMNRRNGETSKSVSFSVTGLKLTTEDRSKCSTNPNTPIHVEPEEEIVLEFENACADKFGPIYIFTVRTSGEKARFRTENRCHKITVKLPKEEGEYFVIQTSRNKYGEYSSNKLFFQVGK